MQIAVVAYATVTELDAQGQIGARVGVADRLLHRNALALEQVERC